MNLYYRLLKTWADGLLKYQIHSDDKAFNGGFSCPSCKMIHGRSVDAIYPYMYLYKVTKDEKYHQAAMATFEYGNNLLCLDGGLYNDAQTTWRYTTVFYLVSLCDTYFSTKEILTKEETEMILTRIKNCANWIYFNLDENSPTNINYPATASLALTMASKILNNDKYSLRGKHLANYVLNHISKNNLLYGESKPHDKKSKFGCVGIDIGYDMEETIPSLVKLAFFTNDKEMQDKLLPVVNEFSKFVLPDGGIDNSFGNRNNKWTYWGSRTSDGISPMFLLFAKENLKYAQVAYLNTLLLFKCTDNVLYGGPDYKEHLESPCTHHTFEHMNALAYVLEHIDEKYLQNQNINIPSQEKFFNYYQEMNTYRISNSQMLFDVTGYDFELTFSGHASGGCLTLVYSKDKGIMIAGSVTHYTLVEPTNMQLPLDIEHHRSLMPRVELNENNTLYSSSDYVEASMSNNGNIIRVISGLADIDTNPLIDSKFDITYSLNGNSLTIKIENLKKGTYVLPLINGDIKLIKGKEVSQDNIFFLTGGFKAIEHRFIPIDNTIELIIS